jgi:biopolymer transport protein ExbD
MPPAYVPLFVLLMTAAPLPPERELKKERPMDADDAIPVLFFNVNKHGGLEVPGADEALVDRKAIKKYLQKCADDKKADGGLARASLVIRADRDLKWGELHDIVTLCREVGFEKIQLRTIQKNTEEKRKK